MQFAKGMMDAIQKQDTFSDDVQMASYWAATAVRVPHEDFHYVGAAGQLQEARHYRGGDGHDAPVLLYIHGGGWAGGSILGHEYSACALAKSAGCNVFSISYRLSPKDPFPAGLNDCCAALSWLRINEASLRLNIDKIAIGGASAGANLALAAALTSGAAPLAGLLLFYGVFGCDFETDSYRTYKDGPGLTRARMQDLYDKYDPAHQRTTDSAITPLLSTRLSHLPPCCLIAAEHDVLLDDSKRMSSALQAAEIETEFHIVPGVTHGFINRGRLVPSANASLARAAAFLGNLTPQKARL